MKAPTLHKHYTALDGLRGLAILLVFIRHSFLTTHLNSLPAQILAWLGSGGWLGVDLFFVLSGFLITGILIDSLNKPRYFKDFYIRRSLRIFPLFYGVLLLCWILTPVLHLQWQLGHLSYLFYCQNIAVDLNPSLSHVPPALNLEHFWSLAVEEQFYMLWPLTIFLLRDPRKIIRSSLSTIAVGLLARCILLLVFPSEKIMEWIYNGLPTHADGLLMGAVFAASIRIWSLDEILRRMRWPVYFCAAIAVAIVAISHRLDFHTYLMSSVGYTVSAILFGGLLLRCLAPGSSAQAFFSTKIMRFFGKYSYGIYVYHLLFTPVLSRLLYRLQALLHSRLLGAMAYLVLWFALSIAVAVVSYKFFESPFLRLKDRFAPPKDKDPDVIANDLTTVTLVGQSAVR
ncbi:acyltransferase [Edaphobacter sp. HDX4]|uniref:acyltransferase family protein n=1 Tax=Edaphobacter sp. HDX4 TaxID=2794064 RepID=UPI002FE684C3